MLPSSFLTRPDFCFTLPYMTLSNQDIAGQLAASGWGYAEDYFPPDLVRALLGDVNRLRDEAWRPAAVGRGGQASADIRTDRTLWLDGGSAAQVDYLGLMGQLRLDLNRALYLGLFDYECHYALYQAGGFYKKHVDSLHGSRNRVVSCVTYLTTDWQEDDAGHLVLYDGETECARILPRAGTLAFFLSEDVPHEVLPPRRERASIAGWFRCNPSGAGRVDPAG
jgi:SM-20-related protein